MPYRFVCSIIQLLTIVFLFLIFSTTVFAGNSQSRQDEQKPSHQFILRQFYTDMTFLLGEKNFYLVVGGLSAGPFVFPSAFKRESPEFSEMWGSSQFADNAFEIGEIVGDGIFPVSVSAASWITGKFTRSSRLQDFGTDLIRAQMANGIVTAAMKGTINRTRPDGTAYSYPSGHTSSTFVTAGVVYRHFGKAWGIPAFALATYVGFSRLQENKHYLSDVIAGGILGSYVSLTLSKRDTQGSSITLSPYRVEGASGVMLSMRF